VRHGLILPESFSSPCPLSDAYSLGNVKRPYALNSLLEEWYLIEKNRQRLRVVA
jgi:hypothetical protein